MGPAGEDRIAARAPAGERLARHGAVVPPGQDVDASREPPRGRFGRLFPGLLRCNVSEGAIDEIVAWMADNTRSRAGNPLIPAGFTYLGQFIDHDITFDPTSTLNANVDVQALVNFRTPRFDLDSVYGSGPVVQPYLYDWDREPAGVRLLVCEDQVDSDGKVHKVTDLPRNSQGRALIGDPRNDETAIITQLHLLFLQLHNVVVDRLWHSAKVRKPDDVFKAARRLVRWHYQWIVVHEFLPAVVGDEMARDVLPQPEEGSPQKVCLRFFKWRRHPFIPVEFSGAAYRFGHSMVRAEYAMQRAPAEAGHTVAMARPPSLFPDLAGFTWLRKEVVIEWDQFFALDGAGPPPQRSQKIDTAIVDPLFALPDEAPRRRSLPRRNLERGRRLGLPSGQDVAAVMHEKPLTERELDLKSLPGSKKELKGATPLWYYILCETARASAGKGRHLGPVGGRIVAEVLAGLLKGDRSSYLHCDPPWEPRELGTDGTFTMADLIDIAQGRRA